MRGPNGYGIINDAGKKLPSFFSVYQATVYNTWFAKKTIHQQTWQHPKSKQLSCIDSVIMSQSDRRMCLDVAVKRGAECSTDHQLVCVKIRLAGGCHRRKKMAGSDGKRYSMSKLVSDGRTEDENNLALRLEFQKQVVQTAGAAWPAEGGVDEKCTAVSEALLDLADELVGKVKGHQPDWLRKLICMLKSLLQSRKCTYTKWLTSRMGDDLSRSKQAQKIAQRATRAEKNSWFQEKAEEAERECLGGKKVW